MHLIWSLLLVMNCLGTVDDGWRASCLLQVVQEYERAVIFRLGRLMSGGAKGPGKEIHVHATCVVVWVFTPQRRKFHTYSMTYLNCTARVCIHLLTRSWQNYNISVINIRVKILGEPQMQGKMDQVVTLFGLYSRCYRFESRQEYGKSWSNNNFLPFFLQTCLRITP